MSLRNKIYYGQCVIFGLFLHNWGLRLQTDMGTLLVLGTLNAILMQSILNRYIPRKEK